MKKTRDRAADADALRHRARKKLEERRRREAPRVPPPDLERVIEELQIHEFELEMQNEDLQQARSEIDALFRRYRDLYEGAPVGFLSLSHDGVIEQCNPAAAELLGQVRSRLTGRHFADLVSPDSRATVAECLSAALATASRQTCEAALLIPPERPPPQVRIEVNAAGGEQGCRVALVDITGLKQAEAALEASEARYRRLFESARDGILLVDAATGTALAANPAFLELLGCPAAACVGRPLWEIEPLSAVAASREAFFEQQSRGDLRRDHLQIETGEGRHADVELVSHSYRVASGNVLQVGLRDIGERLRAEQALGEMERKLELSRRLEAVGRLAGGIAHEFNNQLGVILGFVEILQNRLPPGPEQERLHQIGTAARYSADLTRQLLAFARMQVLWPRLLAPSDLVAGVAPRLSQLLGPGVKLALKLNARGCVRFDPEQLEGALTTLAGNASDAMPAGGTLTIETEDVDLSDDAEARREVMPPARYVMLTVTDTGGGLDATARARVFEPFYSTKPQAKGTGLSLAAVYGTVKQSGGYLFVESAPGPGARFCIYLPWEGAAPDAHPHPAAGGAAT